MSAENNFFLRSNPVENSVSLLCLGSPVHAQFKEIVLAITRLSGKDASSIFAEPVLSHGSGGATKTISWYSSQEGLVVDYASLDETAKASARGLIERAYDKLRPSFSDEVYGSIIQKCFDVFSYNDILLVGGRLVLINWGFEPANSSASTAIQRGVMPQLLGLSASQQPPPEPRVEEIASYAAPAATSVASTPIQSQPNVAFIQNIGGQQHVDNAWNRRWIVPALASIVIILLLALLFGSLLASYRTGPSQHQSNFARFQSDINMSLQDRINFLQNALKGNLCTIPRSELGLPQIQGATPRGGAGGGAGAGGAAGNQVAPPSHAMPNTQLGTPQSETQLIEKLDSATVLVLTEEGMGTGFFISPTQVVTNRHVIEGAKSGLIFVAGKKLRSPMQARLTASTPSSEFGEADFAVLTLSEQVGEPLAIRDSAERLNPVVAAGFPTFIVETDSGFQRLIRGDGSAMPQIAVTQGVITARQKMGLGILAHTATISKGNSGGPLVDTCGQVVAVNTFIKTDQQSQLHGNFALEGSGLKDFLRTNNLPFTAADTCTPSPNTQSGRP
jgi:S1-C subfamily serine protease